MVRVGERENGAVQTKLDYIHSSNQIGNILAKIGLQRLNHQNNVTRISRSMRNLIRNTAILQVKTKIICLEVVNMIKT